MRVSSALDRLTAARDFVEKFFPAVAKREAEDSEPSDLKSVCLRKLERAIERFDSTFRPMLTG